MTAIGLFGGTFDPIHNGHLRTAYEVLSELNLREIRFLPWRMHSLRATRAKAGTLRLDLVKAALAGHDGFMVDDRAFFRDEPVYTVDVLTELRAENPSASLCLISGMDSFLNLHKWHRWQDVLKLVHIVVARRPGAAAPVDGVLGDVLRHHGTESSADLHAARSGRVYIQEVTQLGISATALRASIRAGRQPHFLVPESVQRIIANTSCYAELDSPPEQ